MGHTAPLIADLERDTDYGSYVNADQTNDYNYGTTNEKQVDDNYGAANEKQVIEDDGYPDTSVDIDDNERLVDPANPAPVYDQAEPIKKSHIDPYVNLVKRSRQCNGWDQFEKIFQKAKYYLLYS